MNTYQDLDNPVWHALQSHHRHLAVGANEVKRYPANVLRLLACESPADAHLSLIEKYLLPEEKLFLVGDLPPLPPRWHVYTRLECVQMVCEKPVALSFSDPDPITLLSGQDVPEMLELINLVQPGFFFSDTPLLGDYFGIRVDDQLVAISVFVSGTSPK